MPRKPTGTPTQPLDKARVLEALAKEPQGSKRDLARVLRIKGSERIALKRILKELESDGTIERSARKRYTPAGTLPEVGVLEIIGHDPDGELLALPQRWEHEAAPPRILIVPGREAEAGPALGIGERVLARLSQTGEGYEARVIKRIGAGVHRVLGVYREHAGHGRIEPIDRKSRHEFVVDRHDNGGADSNELVLAEPLAGRSSGLPRARVIERLGSMNEPRAISLIAIHEHGIPTEFPREALAEADGAKPASLAGRTDLRSFPLVTIDPEDARDHDDAVWAAADPDSANKGGHIVIVAIADVAYYVRPGSALDQEARKRGNSAYFPDRVVPMLPERLSADLCSLREDEDRPCLAVRMIFDATGKKRRHEFLRGMMRSAARLTYAQAQRAFDGTPDTDHRDIAELTLAPLWNAYRAVVRARDRRAPLDLDLPERRVVLGPDGHVASIAFRERLESMRLIEEFMIQANVAAAETLEKAHTPLIYRVHEQPSQEKLSAFADYLRSIGMSFAKGQVVKPQTFNRLLGAAKDGPNEEVLNDVVLRTQAQAIYDTQNIGHFGLNLQRYAHFTSPIRRYADLVVHRALIRALHFGDDGLTDREIGTLSETAEHISVCERRAMAAERDSTDRYVAAFMEDRVGAVFAGRITGVTRFGLFVRLKETGADGLVPIRTIGAEFFRHDERRHALVGERSGTSYALGDTVAVRLREAAPLTGGLRFELVEDGAGIKRSSRAAGASSSPPRGSRKRPGERARK
ncbi:MAG TPA: ribonuclease R [Rhizomicrobium sp.]|nr:ribonuclease R [Rhizomicrobium sp.]